MTDVQPVEKSVLLLPGRVVLRVRAAPGYDWEAACSSLQGKGVHAVVLRADDVVHNVTCLIERERGRHAASRREHAAAWQRFAAGDFEARAQRRLLHAADSLCALQARIWDPRLDEVRRLAAAERTFWLAAGAEPPQLAATEPAADVALRLLLERRVVDDAAVDRGALERAQALLGTQRWHVGRQVWDRVRAVCRDAAEHATAKAAATKDAGVAGRYRELATACTTLAQAIDVVLP